MRQRFKVTGMSCAACSAGVERAVGRLKGVNSVEVSLVAKSMVCDFDETIISEKEIANAVKKGGLQSLSRKICRFESGRGQKCRGEPDCGNGRLYSHENAPYCVSDFSRAFDVRIYGAHDRAACSRFYARRS